LSIDVTRAWFRQPVVPERACNVWIRQSECYTIKRRCLLRIGLREGGAAET
jgi:hypothetical protein